MTEPFQIEAFVYPNQSSWFARKFLGRDGSHVVSVPLLRQKFYCDDPNAVIDRLMSGSDFPWVAHHTWDEPGVEPCGVLVQEFGCTCIRKRGHFGKHIGSSVN